MKGSEGREQVRVNEVFSYSIAIYRLKIIGAIWYSTTLEALDIRCGLCPSLRPEPITAVGAFLYSFTDCVHW